jgi:hypothetical protein
MVSENREQKLKIDRLRELLSLDVQGVFTATRSRGNIKVGDTVGCKNIKGYVQIQIDGTLYQAHRLVWFTSYGVWPDGEIGHSNGERSDNRVENLRDVPRLVNGKNQSKRKRFDNSLPTGVAIHRVGGKIYGYRACWHDINGEQQQVYFHLSGYVTHEAAISAATAKRELEMAKLKVQGAAYTERHGT